MSSNSGLEKKDIQRHIFDVEDESRRLARELHDDIGQRLALLADDADRLRCDLKLTDETVRIRFDGLIQQVRDLGEDLRRISHLLHPAIVEDLGLIPALRSLIEDFADRHAAQVRLAASELPAHLPLSLSTTLYRITQEALRNIAKHAGQTSVEISVSAARGEVALLISDSGRGFEPGQPSGLGLTSMRERATLAGGSLVVVSAPGKGTSLQVRIPFASAQAN